MVKISKTDEVPSQVLALRQTCLIHLENLLQLLKVLLDNFLVGGSTKHRTDKALEENRVQYGGVLMGLHLKPHIHHC
uniref:Gst1 n=1 Tax=Arundo donax TaxID=35708 RepID=A0A0A9CX23_ARUDO